MEQSTGVPLSAERGFYIGNVLSGIFYGIQVTLCAQTVHYLRRRRVSARRAAFFTIYSIWIIALMTIAISTNVAYGQRVWIDDRDSISGGPAVYFAAHSSWWGNTFGSTAAVVKTFSSDGLLLYRCIVIVDSYRLVLALPFLLYLALIAFGILYTVLSALPGHFVFSGQTSHFVVAWTSISVAFNIVVTVMISIKLLYARRSLRKIGLNDGGPLYYSIVSILVESAFPLAVSGFIASVLFSIEHPSAFVFMIIWGFFVAAAPQLIIMRVAMGKDWSRRTRTSLMEKQSTLKFESTLGSRGLESHDESQDTK